MLHKVPGDHNAARFLAVLPTTMMKSHRALSCSPPCLSSGFTVENGGHYSWGPSYSETTSVLPHILGVPSVPLSDSIYHLQTNVFCHQIYMFHLTHEWGRTLEYTSSFI